MSLDNRTGGVALLVGYGLLLAALFRDPAAGIEAATASVQGAVFFLLLPTVGLAAGVVTVLAWPYRRTAGFLTGSYLAVVGLALVLLRTANPAVTTGLGAVLFGLAVVAVVESLRSALEQVLPETDFL